MSTAFTGVTTSVWFGLDGGTGAAAYTNIVATTHGTKVGPTSTGPGGTSRTERFKGVLVTGASGGTFSIQFAAGTTGSATVRARSALWIARV
jgi:hypothetical protein